MKIALALALALEQRADALAPSTATAVEGDRVTLELDSSTIESRCHDAARLGALLAAVEAAGRLATPTETSRNR